MLLSFLADLVLIVHLAFVLFVLFGGLLALRWPQAIWYHLPAVAWGATVEFAGWMCPLTPLETWLRARAGGGGYRGDFISHYLLSILYPDALTSDIQTVLGIVVIVSNALIYLWVWKTQECPALFND